MKKNPKAKDDELRPEYKLHQLLKGGVRGKYAERFQAGVNLVLLDPDVAQAFPDDEAVNAASRLVLQLTRIPKAAELMPAGLIPPKEMR